MLHTVPLTVVAMQLGTSLMSLFNTIEKMDLQYKPDNLLKQTQTMVDFVVDLIALIASTSGLLCLFYIPPIKVIFTSTAFNVACLFGAILRIVIETLHKMPFNNNNQHYTINNNTPKLLSNNNNNKPVNNNNYKDNNSTNTINFVITLFFNSILILFSFYLITVLLCVIKRKRDINSDSIFIYCPQDGNLTRLPKKYARLLPILASLLALSGCVALVGFIIEAVLLTERHEVNSLIYWAGMHNGFIALFTGMFLVLTISLSAHLITCHILSFHLIILTFISSWLAFHSEYPEFTYLENSKYFNTIISTTPTTNNIIYFRQIFLGKVTLISFAAIFNGIIIMPLILFLLLHMGQERRVQVIYDMPNYSQTPTYHHNWSQMIPLESMDLTESSLLPRPYDNNNDHQHHHHAMLSSSINNNNNNNVRISPSMSSSQHPMMSHMIPSPTTSSPLAYNDAITSQQMQYFMYPTRENFQPNSDYPTSELIE